MTANSYWESNQPMSFEPEGWNYQEKSEFRYSVIPYLRHLIDFPSWKGKAVTDLGCGSGIDSATFWLAGAAVTSVDASARACNLTEKLRTELQPGRPLTWQVLNEDIRKTSIPDSSQDLVYSFGVLHHIKRPDHVLREATRILKPDGQMLAMLYHRDSLLYAYSILLRGKNAGLNPQRAMREYSERIPGCPHSRAYSRDEAIALFKVYFRDVDVTIEYPVIDLPEQRKLYLKGCPEELGWHLIVRAMMPVLR